MSLVYIMYHYLAERPHEVSAALTWDGVLRTARGCIAEGEDGEVYHLDDKEPELGKVHPVLRLGGEPFLMVMCLRSEEMQLAMLADALAGR